MCRTFDFSGFEGMCGTVVVDPPGLAVHLAIYHHGIIHRQQARSVAHIERTEYDTMKRPYWTIHATPSGWEGISMYANYQDEPTRQDMEFIALRCVMQTESGKTLDAGA